MLNIILQLILLLLISGCTQEPAPISYGINKSVSNYSEKTLNRVGNQGVITRKTLIIEDEQLNKTSGILRIPNDESHGDTVLPSSKDSMEHTENLDTAPNMYLVEQNEAKQTIITEGKTSSYLRPLKGKIITYFNDIMADGSKSNGIEIIAPAGTEISSIASGTVIHVGYDKKFGNLIIIKLNEDNLYVAYAYMEDLLLSSGTEVDAGQLIGHVGSDGSTTAKLYLAIRAGKTAVDPLRYISE